MKPDKYLEKILEEQALTDDSDEMKDLKEEKAKVEKLLRDEFPDAALTIRYGGSKAKDTIIKESYDLDVISYLIHDDNGAGETLEDIYKNHEMALKKKYNVRKKNSALRLYSKEDIDFHIDVVPGRYVDNNKSDSYLYQHDADKMRLKTNLQTHIEHVRDSGYTKEIRLIKLWALLRGLSAKTFVLELLAVKILSDGKMKEGLSKNLTHFWEQLRDKAQDITIKDPANPDGNDLSKIFGNAIRTELQNESRQALKHTTNDDDWEKIFGKLIETSKEDRVSAVAIHAKSGPEKAQPWCATKKRK